MKILVINAGSSSIKLQIIDSVSLKYLFRAKIEEIFSSSPLFEAEIHLPHTVAKKIEFKIRKTDYHKALELALSIAIQKKVIKDLREIRLIGHRVVHGGIEYKNPTVINNKVIKKIEELSELAPLHNPPNLEGIYACKKIFPHIKQVAVFDTTFYSDIPEKAYLYTIPYLISKKEQIRRYGFHGISHQYVTERALEFLRRKNATATAGQAKIISCHMGNGISITASINGRAIDTSMGFTPTEGIPMGTRSGDIDPTIPIFLQKKLRISADEVEKILNNRSGFKGICGTSDMKEIWKSVLRKDKMARLTLEILAYRTAKYIGAYAAAMNGLDAIIFTAGIGEKAWYLRKDICKYLEFLGVRLDQNKNKTNAAVISSPSSKIKIFIIPTNEELLIAKEALKTR